MRDVALPPWIALLLAFAACAERSEAPHPGGLPRELEAVFAGCKSFRPGPSCELAADRSLRVWARVPQGARPRVLIDGRELEGQIAAVDEGILIRLEIPSRAGALLVNAIDAHG